MKKSSKRFISMLLTASMLFSTVLANTILVGAETIGYTAPIGTTEGTDPYYSVTWAEGKTPSGGVNQVTVQANGYAFVEDTDTVATTNFFVPFTEANSGKLTLSGSIIPSAANNSWTLVQVHGTKADGTAGEVLGIRTSGGNYGVRVEAGSAITSTGTAISKGTEVSYKFEMDFDNDTAVVTVGGKSVNVALPSVSASLIKFVTASGERNIIVSPVVVEAESSGGESTESTTIDEQSTEATTVDEQSTEATTVTEQSTEATTVAEQSTEVTTTVPAGNTIVHNFTSDGATSSFFTITGNTSGDKGTVNYNGMTLTQCLKMETSTSITFTAAKAGVLTMVLNNASGVKINIKVDGTKYVNDSGIITVPITAGAHTISKADSAGLFYISFVEEGGSTPTEATTVTEATTETTTIEPTTVTEATTETTTVIVNGDDINIQPVVDGSSKLDETSIGSNVVVDYKVTSNDKIGFNNYTLFFTYDPAVVQPVNGVIKSADMAGYITNSGVPCFNPTALTNQMNLKPGADNSDYTGLNADGVKTAAELGKVKYSWYCDDKDNDNNLLAIKGDGTLFSVEFKVIGKGDANLGVEVVGDGFYPDRNTQLAGDMLAVNAIKGELTIGDVISSETSSETTSETTSETSSETTTEAVVYGDADGDGTLTGSDAAWVMQKVLNGAIIMPIEQLGKPNDYYMLVCDVDGDGQLTASDAAYIMQKVLRSTFLFPVEEIK